MINIITYLKNLFKLIIVQSIINKNRIYKEPKVNLKYGPLLRYPVLNVLKIKLNNTYFGMLISSQRHKKSRITYIDFIWLNRRTANCVLPEAESQSAYYTIMYEVFIQWYSQFIINSIPTDLKLRKVAISIDVTKEDMVEKLRRILTLYGFERDLDLTLEDIDFKAPWREKEKITQIIYSKEL